MKGYAVKNLSPGDHHHRTAAQNGVRAIAIFEACKGALVLIVGFGLLSLLHRDLEAVAEHLVRISHLNPAHHYPRVFIEALTRVDDTRLKFLALIAFLYSVVRFIEAYGLWHIRAWAEWFAIISGGIYLPIEIYELFKHATIIKAIVLVFNALMVAYLIYYRATKSQLETTNKPAATTASLSS